MAQGLGRLMASIDCVEGVLHSMVTVHGLLYLGASEVGEPCKMVGGSVGLVEGYGYALGYIDRRVHSPRGY